MELKKKKSLNSAFFIGIIVVLDSKNIFFNDFNNEEIWTKYCFISKDEADSCQIEHS